MKINYDQNQNQNQRLVLYMLENLSLDFCNQNE